MELDALRYTEFVTYPLQWNVQIDRHPTEGGRFFGVERVQGALAQGAVENARGAAYVVWRIVWDRRDGGFVRYVGRKLWWEDQLCLNPQDIREGLRCKRMR